MYSLLFHPPLPLSFPTAPRAVISSRPRFFACVNRPRNLYDVLNLAAPTSNSSPTLEQIRQAYLTLAKASHPDVSPSSNSFDEISRAYSILSDSRLRRIYDTSGEQGLAAVQSIEQRAQQVRERLDGIAEDELDFLGESGQLVGALLMPGEEAGDGFGDGEDACPRSVEEAIWNIQWHEDLSVRYYGLWWVYRFKVSEAEEALVNILRKVGDEGREIGLKRRAALALGAVAKCPTEENSMAVKVLGDELGSSDYFLRYRAAEALSRMAGRWNEGVFAENVVDRLKDMLRTGKREWQNKEEGKSGYLKQESLFDLDKLDPEVREKLEKVFKERKENENKSRRTTMTPQLGVDEVGVGGDQPYEWIIKAVSAICSNRDRPEDEELIEILETFAQNSVPLVRYAAHKALYAMTEKDEYAAEIVEALEYGKEHHYSQRVLIRDLGDLGYSKGAGAVAACPMVENSFKILALKNMLAKNNHDASNKQVRDVLQHMDSLL